MILSQSLAQLQIQYIRCQSRSYLIKLDDKVHHPDIKIWNKTQIAIEKDSASQQEYYHIIIICSFAPTIEITSQTQIFPKPCTTVHVQTRYNMRKRSSRKLKVVTSSEISPNVLFQKGRNQMVEVRRMDITLVSAVG